jgi:uncharacterized protein (DUF1697 family)
MPRHLALLRGINIGQRRMKMARLVELLEQAGYSNVATYLQSGNVAITSRKSASAVATHLRAIIQDEWGFDVPVVMRTLDEIAAVLAADPFGDVADDHARYSVLFFDETPPREPFDSIDRAAFEPELFELRERELYVWLPGGTGRSPLMQELGRARFGLASATMRNWRTVEALLDL